MLTDRTLSRTDLKHRSAPGVWSELSDMVAHLARDLFSGYRPERHYMRGPGPACRVKRTRIAAAETALDLHMSSKAA